MDQNYYKVNAGLTVNANEAPIQIIAEGFVSTPNLTALSVDLMSKVNTAGLLQKVDVFNFTTNQWVNADQRAAPTTDTRVTIGVPGTASQYVDAANGNIVRLRISYKQTGPVTQSVWGCSIDLGNWLATHP